MSNDSVRLTTAQQRAFFAFSGCIASLASSGLRTRLRRRLMRMRALRFLASKSSTTWKRSSFGMSRSDTILRGLVGSPGGEGGR